MANSLIGPMLRSMLKGIGWSIVGAFPMAVLIALFYRFPIPFSGYQSGLNAMPLSLFAVLFYGLFGGFVVLAVLGAVGGALAHRLAGTDEVRRRRMIFGFAILGDFAALMVLALLDKIVGPW